MLDVDTFSRLIFAGLVILIIAIRGYGHLKAGTLQVARQSYDEGWITRFLRPFPLLILIGSLLYIFVPDSMAWSTVPMPTWLRLMALPLGVMVVGGMAWVHGNLNKHFSGRLEIRPDHTLVTTGPYRWVRHPMYTVVIVLFIAIFLLTANWFIGLGGLLIVGTVIVVRTPKEEAMLLATFGDAYREYMRRTPRYVPRLFSNDN